MTDVKKVNSRFKFNLFASALSSNPAGHRLDPLQPHQGLPHHGKRALSLGMVFILDGNSEVGAHV